MSEIVEGLGDAERERIAELRSRGAYFWIYLCVDGVPPEQLEQSLDVPAEALGPLIDFDRGERPSRRFHANRQEVVFPFHCYLEEARDEGEEAARLHPIDVNVLVHGDYVLTAHKEP